MIAPLSLPEAEQLAEATKTEIRKRMEKAAQYSHYYADVERVESDLAGLRRHLTGSGFACGCGSCPCGCCRDVRRYSANLVRTASLYGASLPVGTPAREET